MRVLNGIMDWTGKSRVVSKDAFLLKIGTTVELGSKMRLETLRPFYILGVLEMIGQSDLSVALNLCSKVVARLSIAGASLTCSASSFIRVPCWYPPQPTFDYEHIPHQSVPTLFL